MKSVFGVVGTAAEAYAIANAPSDYYGGVDVSGMPGWSYLGSGVSRSAYLSPSGVVYKVGDDICNEAEFYAAQMLQDKLRACSPRMARAIKVLHFPKVRYFEKLNILAMEYIEETHDDYIDGPSFYEAEDVACELGMGEDFHRGNVCRMADGRWGLIDLGYERVDESRL